MNFMKHVHVNLTIIWTILRHVHVSLTIILTILLNRRRGAGPGLEPPGAKARPMVRGTMIWTIIVTIIMVTQAK